jgi:hypothetical protein
MRMRSAKSGKTDLARSGETDLARYGFPDLAPNIRFLLIIVGSPIVVGSQILEVRFGEIWLLRSCSSDLASQIWVLIQFWPNLGILI